MKKLMYAVCAAAMLFCTANVFAQKKGDKPMDKRAEKPMDQDPEMMMKKMMEYSTPGEFHKWLEKSNGTWMEEITMWMDPSKPPMKNEAVCENTMILGGRYQQSMTKGDMDMGGGMRMPFEGISTVGYNNATKMFESTWMDNMGTGIVYMKGTFDKEKNQVVFRGSMPDCMFDPKKDVAIREVFHIIDDNTQTMEWYETRNGKENKTMEIRFTRKM